MTVLAADERIQIARIRVRQGTAGSGLLAGVTAGHRHLTLRRSDGCLTAFHNAIDLQRLATFSEAAGWRFHATMFVPSSSMNGN